jgi:hypothetical protein
MWFISRFSAMASQTLLQICNMLLLKITSIVFVANDFLKPRGVVEESLFVVLFSKQFLNAKRELKEGFTSN